jgi:hypothetical protein
MSSMVTLAKPHRSLQAFAASRTRCSVDSRCSGPPTTSETIRRIRLSVKGLSGRSRTVLVLSPLRQREQLTEPERSTEEQPKRAARRSERERERMKRTALAALVAGALLLGACGSDDESSDAATTTGAPATSAATETTAAGSGTTAAGSGTTVDPAGGIAPAVDPECAKGKTLKEGVLTVATGNPRSSRGSSTTRPRAARASRPRSPSRSPSRWASPRTR